MTNNQRTLIILTATLQPMVDVTRSKIAQRTQDYMGAIKRWWDCFQHDPVDILICENSGYDLTTLTAFTSQLNNQNRIRFFQFNGDKTLVQTLGKGAGEAEMLDECFKHNQISGYDYIVKSTGRLFVDNAKQLLDEAIANQADWAIAIRADLKFVDTRFFIIKHALFQPYLLNLGKAVNDANGVFIEHAMLRRVAQAMADGYQWKSFSHLPIYNGSSGTDGKKYNSLKGQLIYFTKNSLHRLAVKFGFYCFL
jgi:hypothetical protein